MEKSKEQRKAVFIKKAETNKSNFELHKRLIEEKLNNWQEPNKSSIEYFYKNGKANGTFLLALIDYAEQYATDVFLDKIQVDSSGENFEKELYKLINAFANSGLPKTVLVHKMQYVTKSCEVS